MNLGTGDSEMLPYDDMLEDTAPFWEQALAIRNGPATPHVDAQRFSDAMSRELATNRMVRE